MEIWKRSECEYYHSDECVGKCYISSNTCEHINDYERRYCGKIGKFVKWSTKSFVSKMMEVLDDYDRSKRNKM